MAWRSKLTTKYHQNGHRACEFKRKLAASKWPTFSEQTYSCHLINCKNIFVDNHFSGRNVHESFMFVVIQTWCILSGCSCATSLHKISKCTRYSHVDMGRTWRVSFSSHHKWNNEYVQQNISKYFNRLKLLWLTFCQLNTNCEVEFLPVYTPNDEEKNNPKLFATNVRNTMAK